MDWCCVQAGTCPQKTTMEPQMWAVVRLAPVNLGSWTSCLCQSLPGNTLGGSGSQWNLLESQDYMISYSWDEFLGSFEITLIWTRHVHSRRSIWVLLIHWFRLLYLASATAIVECE